MDQVSLYERIAAALKWSVADVQSFSMLMLREILKPKHPKLAAEVTALVASGGHIFGPARAVRRA